MKYDWIEVHRDQFPVTRMCRQLGVSRTGYCQWSDRAPSDRSMANARLKCSVNAETPPLNVHFNRHAPGDGNYLISGLTLETIPEPGSTILLGLGLAVPGFRNRKKAKPPQY